MTVFAVTPPTYRDMVRDVRLRGSRRQSALWITYQHVFQPSSIKVKNYRQRSLDTIVGRVCIDSPRITSCPYKPPYFLEVPYSPLSGILPKRATSELQRLQAKLCALLPYRQAAAIVRELLPVSGRFNHVTLRNHTLRVGERINEATLTWHGRRYRSGKLISTALVEFAVNQIIYARICKRQQMRCVVTSGDFAQRLQEYEAASADNIAPETS